MRVMILLSLLSSKVCMSLDRSGPYEVFLADLKRIAAGSADARDASMGVSSGSGIIGELASSATHSLWTRQARHKLNSWAGGPDPWRTANDVAAVLCDIAGVGLVNALDLATSATTSAVPPGRFGRAVFAAFSESATGSQTGARGLKGFVEGFNRFTTTEITRRALPRFRHLVLAAYAQVLVAERADQQVVDTATRLYVRTTLNDVGRVSAPRGHRSSGRPLGEIIQLKSWEADLRSRGAPLPPTSRVHGFRISCDEILGLP